MTKRIRSASSPTASAAAILSAFTLSGPAASGAITGISPSSSAATTAFGRDGTGSPTMPSIGTCSARRPISSPKNGTAVSPIAAHSAALTSTIDSRDDLERLLARHAPAADELHLEPAPFHLGADLRPGSVHDDDLLGLRELEDQLARRSRRPRRRT